MSYVKQQISDTARFIANSLIPEDQEKLQSWFHRQFVTACKVYSAEEKIIFSLDSTQFAEFRMQLAAKQIKIPSDFKVTLFKNGISIQQTDKGDITISNFQKKTPKLRERLENLLEDGYDEEEERDEELEAQYMPPQEPLVCYFSALTLATQPNKEETTISEEKMLKTICKLR